MYDKYKKLQEVLKNTIIRSREWWIVIDISAELKMKAFTIEDETILTPWNKKQIEENIQKAFEKAQQKAQEVAMEKTKEILWFDPSSLAQMMWWWPWGMPWLN